MDDLTVCNAIAHVIAKLVVRLKANTLISLFANHITLKNRLPEWKFLLVLFTCIPFSINAQTGHNRYIDSLKTAIVAAGDDSNKVMLLDRLSFQYSEINPDTGIYYANAALQLAGKIGWKRGIALANADLGFNYKTQSNYAAALEHELYALNIYEALQLKNSVAAMLTNIASLYQTNGNYTKALEYNLTALTVFDSLHMESAKAIVLENIGTIFLEQNEYARTRQYYTQALDINRRRNDTVGMARNLANLGIVDSKEGKYREALQSHMQALDVNTKAGNKNGMQINEANIGNIYYQMHRYDKALYHFILALNITESLKNQAGIAINSGNVGEAYLALAKNTRSNHRKEWLSKAVYYLERAKLLCLQINMPAPLTEFSPYLSEAYSLEGDDRKALEEYKFYEHLKDSVYSVQTRVKISELELNRQMDIQEKNLRIKEKEARIYQLQVKQGRNLRIIYLMTLFFILIITIRSIISFRKSNRSLKRENADQYKAIEERNRILEEIAHMQSHEIRSHVATILGLSNLFKEGDHTEASNKTIIDGITSSAQELDAVIRNVAEKKNRMGDTE